ncbi:MAG: DUF4040 domain-containing protein [Planctomycetota bacterium]
MLFLGEHAHVLILALLVATAVLIVRMRSLWPAVMLTGIFSLLGATWMLWLDAPDVAFTEAAVGAGLSTVLMLGTLALVGGESVQPSRKRPITALVVVTLTGMVLVYGTLDMPHYGDPGAPIHVHPDPSYLETTPKEIDVPNIVTGVLGSYRGYDTFGETVVVFTAAVTVLMLLRRREDDEVVEVFDDEENEA